MGNAIDKEELKNIAILADMLKQYSEGGKKFQVYHRFGKDIDSPTWIDAEPGNYPTVDSSLDCWRLVDIPLKKIDMLKLIDSKILMKFENPNSDYFSYGFLASIRSNLMRYKCTGGLYHTSCIPYYLFWNMNIYEKCPIPEGITYEVMLRDGAIVSSSDREIDSVEWDCMSQGSAMHDVIGVRLIGIENGWSFE